MCQDISCSQWRLERGREREGGREGVREGEREREREREGEGEITPLNIKKAPFPDIT